MITKEDILETFPNIHEAVIEMVLDAEPKTWKDVEMVLAWVGYSVQVSMEKSAKKA